MPIFQLRIIRRLKCCKKEICNQIKSIYFTILSQSTFMLGNKPIHISWNKFSKCKTFVKLTNLSAKKKYLPTSNHRLTLLGFNPFLNKSDTYVCPTANFKFSSKEKSIAKTLSRVVAFWMRVVTIDTE